MQEKYVICTLLRNVAICSNQILHKPGMLMLRTVTILIVRNVLSGGNLFK